VSIETNTKYLTVDVANFGLYNGIVTAKQGDSGTRFVKIKVLNNGNPFSLDGTYPTLRGTKPDGTTIFNSCEIDDGQILVALTEQMLSVYGISTYEIALYEEDPINKPEGEEIGSGRVIASFPFVLNVVKASFNPRRLESTDEFQVLNEVMSNVPLLANLNDYIEKTNNLETDVNNVRESVAGIETKIGNHTIESDVPADAVFTDTTYSPADENNDGLLTSEMYTKIDNIESGAEVNQNAFSSIVSGGQTVTANSKTDIINLVGENLTIEMDQATKTITLTAEASGGGSDIEPSEINGNIVVDGNELKVYDDSEIQEKLTPPEDKTISESPTNNISVGYDQQPTEFYLEFLPAQEMNGYSQPSHNGNGRNKLNHSFTTQTIGGVTFTVNADKTISLSGTATAAIDTTISYLSTDLTVGEKYSYCVCPQNDKNIRGHIKGSNVPMWVMGYDETGNGNGMSASGYSVESDSRLTVTIPNGTVTDGIILRPMAVLQSSSEPYAYADFIPYDNVCPIYERKAKYHCMYQIVRTSPTSSSTAFSTNNLYPSSFSGRYCGFRVNVLTGKLYMWVYIES
jgi:hypothetical protein